MDVRLGSGKCLSEDWWQLMGWAEGGQVSHENENKSSTVQESIHYWRTRRGVYEVWSQS